MKSQEIHLNAASLKQAGTGLLKFVKRYAGILCFLVASGAYGFLIFRINTLNNVQPTESDVSAQASSGSSIKHIDPALVKQLEDLQDNSVNVQTLFEQARNNPFNE